MFIGPAESARSGLLKGEFLDRLESLPVWLHTKYYCVGFHVYNCKNSKLVNNEEMLAWMLGRENDQESRLKRVKPEQRADNIHTKREASGVAYRLQKIEIINITNDRILWKTPAGPNTISRGSCLVLEDILFIVKWPNEHTNFNKRHFREYLQKLPQWDQTEYYCPKLSLHDCKTGNRVQPEMKKRTIEKRAMGTQRGIKRPHNWTGGRFKKPELLVNWSVLFIPRVRKFLTDTVALMLLTSACLLKRSTRLRQALKKKWHYLKGKFSEIHPNDD